MSVPKSDGQKIKVLGILGVSSCGSTILNMILDSHPNIVGAGELMYLLDPKNQKACVCTECGEQCRFWSDDNKSKLTENSLYKNVADIFGKHIIVDSSKSVQWFRDREASENEVDYCYVVLVKHPIRQIASRYLTALTHDRWDGSYHNAAEKIATTYRGIDTFVSAGRRSLVVQYEDVVLHFDQTLAKILTFIGQEFTPDVAFHKYDHHQLAGNAGVVYDVQKKRLPDQKLHEIRKAFYEKNEKVMLRLDDKHKNVFSRGELCYLLSLSSIQEMLRTYSIGAIDDFNELLLGWDVADELHKMINAGIPVNSLVGWSNAHDACFSILAKYLEVGNKDEALRVFAFARNLFPSRGNDYYNLGRKFKDLECFHEAEELLTCAVEWSGVACMIDIQGASHYHLGDIALRQLDYTKALRHFVDSKRVLPAHRKAAEYITEILLKHYSGKVAVWGRSEAQRNNSLIEQIERAQVVGVIENNENTLGKPIENISLMTMQDIEKMDIDALLVELRDRDTVEREIHEKQIKPRPLLISL